MYNSSIFLTEDGSHSLYIKELDEQYHSKHGAIQESNHIYIQCGLLALNIKKDEPINILEIGLGTGLNALLTIVNSTNISIKYTALEPYPISMDIIQQLNYTEILKNNDLNNVFKLIHNNPFGEWAILNNNMDFIKYKETIQNFNPKNETYDLVYFDAFAPKIQPEMWTKSIFDKLFQLMETNSILVTYCAQGKVKRNLKEAGFTIESIPGPIGKREIIRAIK